MADNTEKPRKPKLSGEDIEARTRAILILTLAGVLGVSVLGILLSVMFISQPMEQAPNDAAFLKILEPLMFSIGGALTGLAAGRAIGNNNKDEEAE
jgi:Na+/proline symporter